MRRILPILLMLAACSDEPAGDSNSVPLGGDEPQVVQPPVAPKPEPEPEPETAAEPAPPPVVQAPTWSEPPRGYAPPEQVWEPTIASASDEGERAISKFKLPEGMEVSLWAAEPMLANPVAFDVDARGRVFVAETFRQETEGVPDNRTFPEWLHDDLKLQTVAERAAMYLKHHPEFAEQWTDADDRIRLLEDTDGDGRADRSTVFAHGFRDLLDGTGAGVLARGDDVYYTCIPRLWKLTDTDGDGEAESGEALHHGYGVRVAFRGHDMHGLVLGPDRRLYFSVGDRGYHVQTAEGEWLSEPGRGAVFRCELDGTGLEVYAHGLRNPQELAFDDSGNLFTVDNNCDAGDRARLVYLMEQGDSGWSMNFQYLPDRGPWMSEDWWKPAGQGTDQPAFVNFPVANMTSGPSGFAHYPGVGLPAEYDGSFFISDFTGGAGSSGVRRFTLAPVGAGFQVAEQENFWGGILVTDFAFGPDGAAWASDWVQGWIGVGKGRLYRAVHRDADAGLMAATAVLLAGDFRARNADELVALLAHPDRRVRLEAQWALVDRSQGLENPAAKQALAAVASGARVAAGTKPELARLHAVWGLKMLGDADTLKSLLRDAPAPVAAQAAWALGECAPTAAIPELAGLLRGSSDPRERYHAALALGKGGDSAAFALLVTTLREVGEDRFLRHALTWSMSRTANDVTLAAMKKDTDAVVRLGAVLALRHQRSPRLADYLEDDDLAVAAEAARAIYDLRVMAAFPHLAGLAAMPAGAPLPNMPRPLLRRALAAAHYLGRTQDASNLLARWHLLEDDAALRKEVRGYIERWASPNEFDPILNEAWDYPVTRAADAFAEVELPFEGADRRDAVARGRDIFAGHETAACTRCHSIRGVTPPGAPAETGPDLSGVGLRHDAAGLRQSIVDPYSVIAAGYEVRDVDGSVLPVSTMLPNFGDVLTDQEISDLVAFLGAQKRPERILVHVESAGFEHQVAKADEQGLSLVERQWMAWADEDPRFEVVIDRSAERFTPEGLAEFDAVFFYTTGELAIPETGRQALMDWIRAGGGFTGAHCATDTFYEWPEFGAMLGGYFDGHPWHEEVGITVEDPYHVSTRHLGDTWTITDEIYQFREPYSRDRQSVLLSLDTLSVPMDKPGIKRQDLDFAVAWTRLEGQGRVFYSSLGHRPEVWRDPVFRKHLVEGVLWAGR